MSEVMRPHRPADRFTHRRAPEPPAKEPELEWPAFRGGEDQSIPPRMGTQVASKFLGQERWERDRPAGGGGLERLLHPQLTPQQVESIDPERSQLAWTQSGVGACQNEDPVARADAVSQVFDSLDFPRPLPAASDSFLNPFLDLS